MFILYSVTGKRCIAASTPLQVQDALTDLSDFTFATGLYLFDVAIPSTCALVVLVCLLFFCFY